MEGEPMGIKPDIQAAADYPFIRRWITKKLQDLLPFSAELNEYVIDALFDLFGFLRDTSGEDFDAIASRAQAVGSRDAFPFLSFLMDTVLDWTPIPEERQDKIIDILCMFLERVIDREPPRNANEARDMVNDFVGSMRPAKPAADTDA